MAKSQNPTETRLDEDVTVPSTNAPGDAPFDTTDPTERASTVGGDKEAAAKAGHLTVNAAVPVDQLKGLSVLPPEDGEDGSDGGKGRTETYKAQKPDGTIVTVTRNMDTGEHKVS